MAVPLVLIGRGYDGPRDEVVCPASLEDAYSIFGGYTYSRQTLSATDTEITLPIADPRATTYYTYNEQGGLSPYDNISVVSEEDDTVIIDRLGTAAELIVRCVRPVTNGDLIKGYAEALQSGYTNIGLYRVGGECSYTYIGMDPNIKILLQSIYPGSLYNNTYVTYEAGLLTIIQPPGKGKDILIDVYPDSTAWSIAAAINMELAKGNCWITAQVEGNGIIEIEEGTYQLLGGTDGSYTNDDIVDVFSHIDLSDIGIISILGADFRAESGEPDITGQLFDNIESIIDSPIIFVQGVRNVDDYEGYASKLAQTSPVPYQNLFITAGYISYTYPYEHYISSPAPLVAAIAANEEDCFYRCLNAPCYPNISDIDADMLADAGFIVPGNSEGTSYIIRDTASDPESYLKGYMLYVNTAYAVNSILQKFIGRPSTDASTAEAQIDAVIDKILGIRSHSQSVSISPDGSMIVDISITPIGSVKEFRFAVKLTPN